MGGNAMSDTPRTDAAITGSNGQWCFELRDVAREMERELNEANTDRQRLRDALTQAGAGQFLDTISATPPPLVVAKADADAVAAALEMVRDADNDCRLDGFPTIPPAARFRIDNALETYRTKYP
jgi:7-keto-8-aminopelargonate synthetase-like enzyme